MTPQPPRYQEGFQAGAAARDWCGNGSPRLSWVISAPVVSSTFEEVTKRELHPFDAFPRLLDHAERNLPPDRADAFRFRWFGLRYLAPARDGFRLRVRVPGGRLQAWQLRGLAELAQELASGYVLINENAGVDLQTVSIRDAPEAVRRVEALGLGTRGTDGDCLRAVVIDRCDFSESDALQNCVGQLELLATRDRVSADLPRGCVIRFCAVNVPCEPDGGNTLLLQADANRSAAFRVRWSGGESDLGVLLSLEQAASFCAELLGQWARHADRTTRAAATLANFCTHYGPAALLAALERQLPFTLNRVAAVSPASSHPTISIVPGTENTLPKPVPGRLLSAEMYAHADWATAKTAGIVKLADLAACKEIEPDLRFMSNRIRLPTGIPTD